MLLVLSARAEIFTHFQAFWLACSNRENCFLFASRPCNLGQSSGIFFFVSLIQKMCYGVFFFKRGPSFSYSGLLCLFGERSSCEPNPPLLWPIVSRLIEFGVYFDFPKRLPNFTAYFQSSMTSQLFGQFCFSASRMCDYWLADAPRPLFMMSTSDLAPWFCFAQPGCAQQTCSP